MSSSPVPDESPFTALPASTQRIIDNAFNSIANPSPPPPRKKRKTYHNASVSESNAAPGGFIVDDVQPGGFIVEDAEPSDPAGGFIPSSSTPPPTPQSHIPFSLIPRALQLLSLPPDDPEILSVFQNAASGWKSKTKDSSASSSESPSFGEGETVVGRDDWRAVCAVLLEDPPGGGNEDAGVNREEEEESEGGSDAEEYQEEDEDEESEPSSDDTYTAGASKKSKPTRKSRRVQSPTSESSDSSKRLNRQQTQACRVAFSLFFPSIPDSSLDQQRITIRDIDRVAKLLKEKIKAEEIVEMLEVFSSEPDKSMGLKDFEKMMVEARLV